MTATTANRPLAVLLAVALMATFWTATLSNPAQHQSESVPMALASPASAPVLM
ncbi:hypothetical protein [Novosphingobium album (ex Liu et al. 2023)]|uniref:Uncharacterized protein n=1 Tax=Novosphingobium album (ex Liu et al. 2023) TaxID=3031130 RepID=A0ABT5WLZ3_9SPHN|nr:hypothetical protein [Novosphingobium album (ex Liu et al. 2023)]MDE8651068.1 hypothetical protein [Novosphingobium album (ex Liu et al. 2023)]